MSCGCGGLDMGLWHGCAPGGGHEPGPCAPHDPDPCPGSCGGGGSACAELEAYHSHAPPREACPDGMRGGCVAVGPCGPWGEENDPIPGCQYRASVGVTLQQSVDSIRRIAHEFGLRPYHVALVWTRRDRNQVFQEVRRLELVPAKVSSLSEGLANRLAASGYRPDGAVRVSKVSPRQVNEDMLRGHWRGKPPAQDEEFFFEVYREPACAEGDTPRRHRFTLGSVPYLDGAKFGWDFVLVDQEVPRSPAGRDQDTAAARPAARPIDRLDR